MLRRQPARELCSGFAQAHSSRETGPDSWEDETVSDSDSSIVSSRIRWVSNTDLEQLCAVQSNVKVVATCIEDVAIRQQSRTIVNPSVLQAAGGRPSPTQVMNQSGLLSCS